VGIEPTTQGL